MRLNLQLGIVMKVIKVLLLSLVLLSVFQVQAYAQSCNDLDHKPEWMDGLQYVKNAVETKSWDNALQRARELVKICDKSPMLNYYISLALEGTGDKIKALQYIQKASENTFVIATSPEAARLIWYTRHDAEFPERTEHAQNLLQQTNRENLNTLSDLQQEQKDDLSIGLWTGVGVAAAGIALTTAGAVLAFKDDNHIDTSDSHITYDGEKIFITGKPSTIYTTGLILMGAGISAVMTGTILTAVFGYKYTHIKQHQFSAFATPRNIAFTMTF